MRRPGPATGGRLLLSLGLAAAVTIPGAPSASAAPASCPTYNPPNELVLASGTPQSARLGTPFATNLAVSLVNTDGCPITTPLAGIAVTFTAPASGPSGSFSSSGSNAVLVGTNASGQATAPQFDANTLAGGYQVVASSEVGSVSFSLVNTAAGIPATVVALSPKRQSATVSNRYAHPLQAQVLDANGVPVPGAAVTFSLGSGGGQGGSGQGGGSAGAAFQGGASQATEQTDASGIATSPPFRANPVPGRYTATATVGGSNATAAFSLDNLAAKPPRITTLGATHRSATVGDRYRTPLKVRVETARGAPLQGATVTFTLGTGGGGGGQGGSGGGGASFVGGASQATETTDARGIAVSPRFTANSTAGAFIATATVAGSHAVASFHLDNRAGRAPTVRPLRATGQHATVDGRYRRPLEVKVRDGDGHPLQGATVTFTLGTGGGGGGQGGSGGAGASFVGGASQATETTDARGIAVSPRFTANSTAGAFIATATVAGSHAVASFHLDNRAGAPTTVTAGAAATESTAAGTRFPIPLAVTVTDKDGNPVKGALVTFSAPAGGASGRFVGPHRRRLRTIHMRTNASGIAVARPFVAGRTAGGYAVTASVRGVMVAAFALVNQS